METRLTIHTKRLDGWNDVSVACDLREELDELLELYRMKLGVSERAAGRVRSGDVVAKIGGWPHDRSHGLSGRQAGSYARFL